MERNFNDVYGPCRYWIYICRKRTARAKNWAQLIYGHWLGWGSTYFTKLMWRIVLFFSNCNKHYNLNYITIFLLTVSDWRCFNTSIQYFWILRKWQRMIQTLFVSWTDNWLSILFVEWLFISRAFGAFGILLNFLSLIFHLLYMCIRYDCNRSASIYLLGASSK